MYPSISVIGPLLLGFSDGDPIEVKLGSVNV